MKASAERIFNSTRLIHETIETQMYNYQVKQKEKHAIMKAANNNTFNFTSTTMQCNEEVMQKTRDDSAMLNSTAVTLTTTDTVNLSSSSSEADNYTKEFTWEKHSTGFASRILNKMGYKGKGLGKQEDGITEPIVIQNTQGFRAEGGNKVKRKRKRKVICVLSDSMLNQIDEKLLSTSKYDVKVMCHGGSTIEGMYSHLNSVIPLNPKYLLLHVGTNNCTNNTSDDVLKKLKSLKEYIEKVLPSCKVCLSLPTLRTDNSTASAVIRNLNTKLMKLDYMLMDNSNISELHIGKKGLHFNEHGTRKIASNIISLIKRF